MTDKRIVMTTAGSKDEADKIATALVDARLAACVNVLGPMASTYRWQGKVERAEEFLLLIKTTAAATESVRAALKQTHSYEVPELVVLTIESGSDAYLEWIAENVS